MSSVRPGLGQVIRELREARAPRLSQEELGRQAGYRTGAGVSMSRIENGVTRPGPRRLEGIATALGVTVRELESRVAQHPPGATPAAPPAPDAPTASATGTPVGESTRERMRRIQIGFEGRHTEATAKAEAFNLAHDRARDEFFLALVRATRTIRDLPASSSALPSDGAEPRQLGPAGEAALRRQVVVRGLAATMGSGAAAMAADAEPDPESAYDAVVAAAILDPAPPTAHPERPDGATARVTRSLLGGGTPHAGSRGVAAGTLLAGLLATVASPLFAATTLAWLARRSRRQNEQLRVELDQADANLVATERGFDAVMDLLGRSTDRLDYIAVHGGHALLRWQGQLPTEARVWGDLSGADQSQYRAFVEVAAAQVCVDTVNMTELLAATGPQQSALLEVADAILTLAQQDVERLV
ncbi:MAG: helix-turn-helix transcriptional regulator [Lapillicoccus sp.]